MIVIARLGIRLVINPTPLLRSYNHPQDPKQFIFQHGPHWIFRLDFIVL